MERNRIGRRVLSLAALCLALFCFGGERAAGAQQEVVGYYASWAAQQGISPEQLPVEGFTQINYAFAAIEGPTGRIILSDRARDEKNLAELTALRNGHPALKIVLSVGGWDDSLHFSAVAASAEKRANFAQSCAELVARYGLDGVDLDWEYPVSGGAPGVAGRPADRENFTLLLKDVRRALDGQGRRDGKTYRLTIAGGIGGGYLKNIEAQKVAETVDFIFLMAYDIHGSWDRYTDLLAPLYTPEDRSPQYRYSVDSGVSAWLAQGVPAERLVLGIPLYGYVYEGVTPGKEGLYCPFRTARSAGYDALKRTYLGDPGYIKYWHETAQAPYLWGGQTFVSYEDGTSAAAKGELARQRGLGGIGFWELSQDAAGELTAEARRAFGAVGPFRDVSAADWYGAAAVQMYEAGLINGTAPGVFSPREPVTRGMLVTVLHRLAGVPQAEGTPFSDVPAGAYCAQAVAWAAQAGVAEGAGGGLFRPGEPVQRQQAAAMLWRYASLTGKDSGRRAALDAFADGAQVRPYAASAMAWAVAEELFQGTNSGALLPEHPMSRSELAVLLARFLPLLEER